MPSLIWNDMEWQILLEAPNSHIHWPSSFSWWVEKSRSLMSSHLPIRPSDKARNCWHIGWFTTNTAIEAIIMAVNVLSFLSKLNWTWALSRARARFLLLLCNITPFLTGSYDACVWRFSDDKNANALFVFSYFLGGITFFFWQTRLRNSWEIKRIPRCCW